MRKLSELRKYFDVVDRLDGEYEVYHRHMKRLFRYGCGCELCHVTKIMAETWISEIERERKLVEDYRWSRFMGKYADSQLV